MRKSNQLNLLVVALIFLLIDPGKSQDQQLEHAIDNYLNPVVEGKNFIGCVLVSKDGELLVNKGYGHANLSYNISNSPQTKFHIASLSKSFTAAAVLLLEQEGFLQTYDPITKYLPELIQFKNVTIHHLLGHYSGIPDINRQPFYDELEKNKQTASSLTKIIKELSPVFDAGEKYSYSNSNYNLLARIIEVVTGQDFGTYIQNRILDPIGLINTGHHQSMQMVIGNVASGYIPSGGYEELENSPYLDWSVKTGNGSLYSTSEDLLRWISALMSGELLNENQLEKMIGHSYGWFVREKLGQKAIYYNGNSPGFNAYMAFFPESELIIIVLGNCHIPLATTIGEGIAAMTLNKESEFERFETFTPVRIEKELLKTMEGVYEFPYYSFEIAIRNGMLVYTAGYPGYDIPLIPLSENKFFNRFFWTSLIFEKDSNGKITQVCWEYNPQQKGNKVFK